MSSKPTRTAAAAGLLRAFRAFTIELKTVSTKGVLFSVARCCLSENNWMVVVLLLVLLLKTSLKEHLRVNLGEEEEVVMGNLGEIFDGRIGYGCNRGGVHLMVVFVWRRKGVVAMGFGGDWKLGILGGLL